ncbi:hypothetical protein AVEN_247539-1 [Araneus ventricosus]|uniref:Uncharacterized protein n=1 Tax=Araneus ventricosus TaxID=182803 RepID=A0A4Y2LYY6_ARAVE|nr:hypothetical protein AVEN_233649-1 [Araneus ventricosus]GBN19786.1 hypothetical protein AVEN_247539-1 [Araneus ventricosus]
MTHVVIVADCLPEFCAGTTNRCRILFCLKIVFSRSFSSLRRCGQGATCCRTLDARIRLPIPCPTQAEGSVLFHLPHAHEGPRADIHLLPQVL